MIAAGDEAHPLRFPALRFLHEAGLPRPTPASLWPSPAPNSVRTMPPTLTLGHAAEMQALGALQISKNTEVWRPSPEQIGSRNFQTIVGAPHYTATGLARGTVLDSVAAGFAEIKSGGSILESTYQLRLQTYRSVVEKQPLTIYTSRPIDVGFGHWLNPHGVAIKPLPSEPEP